MICLKLPDISATAVPQQLVDPIWHACKAQHMVPKAYFQGRLHCEWSKATVCASALDSQIA
jgi:hypothetical protein